MAWGHPMAEAALKENPAGVDISEAEELAGIKANAPKDEPKPDARPEKTGKAKADEPKLVPHESLHEERTKRQAVERELKAYRKEQEERTTRLDERLRILTEAMQPKEQQRTPDLSKDPLGYVRSLEARVAAQEQETASQRKARETAEAAQQQEGNLWSNYRASGREYTKATPDFPDAYAFLLQSRAQELEIMGFDPAAIQRQLKSDEFNLAQHAFQTGNDPADILYRWAKQRGYAGKPAQTPNGQANGKAQPSEIDRLRAAQDASETLSKGGSASADGGKITLETIDRMSEDEYRDFVARMTSKDPAGFDKLLARLEGGRR